MNMIVYKDQIFANFYIYNIRMKKKAPKSQLCTYITNRALQRENHKVRRTVISNLGLN